MQSRRILLLVLMLMIVGTVPPVNADQELPGKTALVAVDHNALPSKVTDVNGVERNLFRDGRVYVGGQPSEAALESLRDLGVTAVVNLRTPGEMEDREQVPFDEAEAVKRLGMEYVWLPLGGEDYPYTPDAVDAFARVLERHDGPVFVHCTIGWRASYLWVAYLVSREGLGLEDAFERGRAIAIGPSPLEGLLGRPLGMVYR